MMVITYIIIFVHKKSNYFFKCILAVVDGAMIDNVVKVAQQQIQQNLGELHAVCQSSFGH